MAGGRAERDMGVSGESERVGEKEGRRGCGSTGVGRCLRSENGVIRDVSAAGGQAGRGERGGSGGGERGGGGPGAGAVDKGAGKELLAVGVGGADLGELCRGR